MKQLGCVFAFMFMLIQVVQGQGIQLRGKVVDGETGEAIVGASVRISQTELGAFTDDGGKYQLALPNRPDGQLELVINFSGYRESTTRIVLGEEVEVQQDISLFALSYLAEDVVITATRGFEQQQADVTVSIEVVKPRDIYLQAASGIDKILSQVPGVDNLGGQINIRGSSGWAFGVGSRVMVMLDGLPLLSGGSGTAQLSLIPVDNLSQVEFLKGASSVLYGSGALGGVINVISADPGEKPLTSVRFLGSIYDSPRNRALDWTGDEQTWRSSLHIFHSRKIGKEVDISVQANLIKDTGYRQGTDREAFRGFGMFRYRPKAVPGLTVGFNASAVVDSGGTMLYWHKYHPDTLNGVVSGGALTPSRDASAYRLELSEKYTLDPMVKYLSPKGNLFWYRGRLLLNNNRNNTQQDNTNSTFYNDFLYQTTLKENINWVSGITYVGSSAQGDSLYSGKRPGSSLGVYTQFDAKFGRLNTSLGLRFESVKIDTLPRESQPIFRAGINYELWRGANVRASFGQAFRSPTVTERFTTTSGGQLIVEPNPNIQSETGYSAEIAARQGYRLNTGAGALKGYLDVAAFQMRYNNMIEFGLDEIGPNLRPIFRTRNVAEARIRGVELTTQNFWTLNEKWFVSLSGGITLIEPDNLNAAPAELQMDLSDIDTNPSRLLDIFNTELKDQPETLKYRSRNTTRFSASVGYQPLTLTVNYRRRSFIESIDQYLYIAVAELGVFRDLHPEGAEVMDVIMSYAFGENSTLSFHVENALNAEYNIIPGWLGEQRKFTLQYVVKF